MLKEMAALFAVKQAGDFRYAMITCPKSLPQELRYDCSAFSSTSAGGN